MCHADTGLFKTVYWHVFCVGREDTILRLRLLLLRTQICAMQTQTVYWHVFCVGREDTILRLRLLLLRTQACAMQTQVFSNCLLACILCGQGRHHIEVAIVVAEDTNMCNADTNCLLARILCGQGRHHIEVAIVVVEDTSMCHADTGLFKLFTGMYFVWAGKTP